MDIFINTIHPKAKWNWKTRKKEGRNRKNNLDNLSCYLFAATENKSNFQMKLRKESLKWALKNIKLYDDTDLFPLPYEFEVIWKHENKFIDQLSNIDISNYNWDKARRFIIPKSDLSYRVVTQLFPTDTVLFTALMYEIGSKIESKRISKDSKKVFTYRFAPDLNGYMYTKNNEWIDYWKQGIELANNSQYVLQLDISDFYNQIYHHTIENELIGCGVGNSAKKAIINLLNSTTKRVSRGIPIGPFPAHMLAEMSLIPIDNSLTLRGYSFVRFADDYIFFANSESVARSIVYEFASIIDREQRLSIQNKKTKIYKRNEFIEVAKDKISDQPINNEEKELMAMLRLKSGNNPYANIRLYDLEPWEMAKLKKSKLENLIQSYLDEEDVDFNKIRWIYRRLSQVGTPNLIEFSIQNFETLLPAINDVCHYLLSIKDNYTGDWKEIGETALDLLNIDLVKSNEYFQIAIINLFSSNVKMNHFDIFLSMYHSSSDAVKRKIILMAMKIDASSWIREQKENVGNLSYWSQSAYYMAITRLNAEEKKFLRRTLKLGKTDADLLQKFILSEMN